MSLELYQRAILTADLSEEGLRAGDVGAIVEQHVPPAGGETGYSVEFFDMTGQTVAVVTVPASSLREPTPRDLPSVRVVSTSQH